MKQLYPDKVRETFAEYTARKGHGSLQDMAERIKVSRQHLSRFKSGGSMGENHLVDLASAMAGEGYPVEGIEDESPEPRQPKDPDVLLADDFRNIAEILESPHVPKEIKTTRYVQFIKGHFEGLSIYSKLLEKNQG